MCSQYKHKKQIQQSFANKNSNPSADMALASPVLIATSGSSENIIPSDRLSKSVIRHIRCRQTACSQTSDTGVRISAGDRVRRPHNPEANNTHSVHLPTKLPLTISLHILLQKTYICRADRTSARHRPAAHPHRPADTALTTLPKLNRI